MWTGVGCATGTRPGPAQESCWKAVGGALPSPMACRDPQGSSKASSIPSLALWLCPLWSALLMLQESTGRSVLLFSSSASTFCTWSQSRVAGAPQTRFLLTDLPLTMPTFLCIVSSSDETFPPSLLESWPTFILPAEMGLCTEKIPVALCNFSVAIIQRQPFCFQQLYNASAVFCAHFSINENID